MFAFLYYIIWYFKFFTFNFLSLFWTSFLCQQNAHCQESEAEMQIKQIKESMATFKRAESHNEGGGTRSRRDRLRSGNILCHTITLHWKLTWASKLLFRCFCVGVIGVLVDVVSTRICLKIILSKIVPICKMLCYA